MKFSTVCWQISVLFETKIFRIGSDKHLATKQDSEIITTFSLRYYSLIR